MGVGAVLVEDAAHAGDDLIHRQALVVAVSHKPLQKRKAAKT